MIPPSTSSNYWLTSSHHSGNEMICVCSLAGTWSCLDCPNNPSFVPAYVPWPWVPVYVPRPQALPCSVCGAPLEEPYDYEPEEGCDPREPPDIPV